MPSSGYSVGERRNESEGEVMYESGSVFVCFVFFLINGVNVKLPTINKHCRLYKLT